MLDNSLPFAKKIVRFRWAWAILLYLLFFVWGVSFADESPPVVGSEILSASEINYPPFCMVDDNGQAYGFSIELFQAALHAMGRTVTFRTGAWEQVRMWLETGEIQALPLVGRTPEREANFDFTFPYMSLHGAIVVRKNTTGIHVLNDLKGRTVAVMKGDNAEEFLKRQYPGVLLRTTVTFEEALNGLSQDNYDAVVIQRLVGVRLIRQMGLTNLQVVNEPLAGFRQDFCFAVKEGDDKTLALLNEGLALVMADGTYRQLHAKWFAALTLTTNRRIIMGGDQNYPPYEYLDEKGMPTGYNTDLTMAIAKEVGLDVEIRLGPWDDIRAAMARGEIDALQGMFYSPQRDLTYDFTPPHTVNHCVSIIRKGSGEPPATINGLAGKQIVVQKGDIMHDFVVENSLENQTVVVGSQEDALVELSRGEHDCALAARLTALYWIKKNGLDNLVVGQKPFLSPGYCYAVPQNQKALLAQLGEGLKVLDENGEYRRIYEKWMGVYEDKTPNLFVVLTYGAWIIIPLILLLLGVFFWSWSLKRQVTNRTMELQEREGQYRLLADNMLDAIWTMDLDLVFTYVNQASLQLVGYLPEEMVGKSITQYCDEENFAIMAQAVEKGLNDGPGADPVFFETALIHKEGKPVPVEIHGKVLYNERHEPVGLQGITRDISQRKQAEEWLHRSEDLLNTTQRISKVGGWEWTIRRQEMFWTEETFRIHGFSPDTGEKGRTYIRQSAKCYPEKDRARLMAAFRQCIEKGTPYEEVTQITAPKGKQSWVRISGNAIYEGDRIVKVAGSIQDITEWRLAEDALTYQAIMLREMGRIAKIGAWEFDPETGEGSWTEEVARIYELDPKTKTNREIGLRFFQGASKTKIEKAIQDAIALDKPYDLELELHTAKGHQKWVRSIGLPIKENGKIVQVRGSFQDITAGKIAEQRIEHLNRVLWAIRDLNQLIVQERDPQRLVQEGCQLLVKNRGYSSAVIILTDEADTPLFWTEAGMGDSFDKLVETFKQGELPPCCDHAKSKTNVLVLDDKMASCRQCPIAENYSEMDNLCIDLAHESNSFGYLIVSMEKGLSSESEEQTLFSEIASDLAYALNALRLDEARKTSEDQRKILENQLFQAQKMESVGRLAGGIAHDYNNMLSVIIGYSELAMEKTKSDASVQADLREILKAAQHSTDITRQLLAFARQQTISPKLLDLNDTMASMLNMLHRLIGEDIDLAWLPGANLWPIHIDPSQVDQILANLAVNARDAISGIGKITIETENVRIDKNYSIEHPEAMTGEYVMLSVSDDGVGMDPEIMENIFEPFFTTKGIGEGTGLGLATVYGIVKQNNGFITVFSEPGEGTTFKIYLPNYIGEKEEIHDEDAEKLIPKGEETILLVEDELSILLLGKRILESLGYTVLDANSPGQALLMAKTHGGKIHMLISDVIMPEMNGRDLSTELQPFYPDLKTLFMSGYTANVIAHRGVLDKGVNFIQKPFAKRDLAVKVRGILDGLS